MCTWVISAKGRCVASLLHINARPAVKVSGSNTSHISFTSFQHDCFRRAYKVYVSLSPSRGLLGSLSLRIGASGQLCLTVFLSLSLTVCHISSARLSQKAYKVSVSLSPSLGLLGSLSLRIGASGQLCLTVFLSLSLTVSLSLGLCLSVTLARSLCLSVTQSALQRIIINIISIVSSS